MEKTPNLQKQRTEDKFIMEELSKQYSNSKLDRLNRVRKRLGVVTLSDITSGDGRTILEEAFTADLTAPGPRSRWNQRIGGIRDKFEFVEPVLALQVRR